MFIVAHMEDFAFVNVGVPHEIGSSKRLTLIRDVRRAVLEFDRSACAGLDENVFDSVFEWHF